MKSNVCRRSVKLLSVSTLLLLSAHILLETFNKHYPKSSPLPVEESRLLSPQTYKYIINQPEACKQKSPFLVFVVPVAPLEEAAREAVRRTWGSAGPDTLTLFFTGLDERSSHHKLLEESREHADIIQLDFVDSYQNLTIKTMMMMNWLATHCPDAYYAMKVDADIFVNVFYLIRWLSSSPRQDYITGSVISDGRPRRDSSSKWHISEELYPDDSFPTYVSGAGYVFSLDLPARISWASRFVRMIPLEDVYVGLCLRVLGVRPAYCRSLLTFRNLFEIRNLEYDRCVFARLILVNGFKPSRLLQVWQDFAQGHENCIVLR